MVVRPSEVRKVSGTKTFFKSDESLVGLAKAFARIGICLVLGYK